MAITFAEAWRKSDTQLEAEARAFWMSLDVPLINDASEQRPMQLAVIAYDEGKLIAVSTVEILFFDLLQQKFGFMREFVANDQPYEEISGALTQKTRAIVEAHARAHPEENIAGLAAVLQTPGIGQRAVSPGSGLVLMGYTDKNEQVRACWFDHFRVKPRLTNAS